MNRQNFNPEEIGNYPLTIERMKELQEDLQAPLRILAEMAGGQNCILAGCETAGAAGYVLVNGEVLEVKEYAITGNEPIAFRIRSSVTSATNSDGEEVTVREERWAEWTPQLQLGGVGYVIYGGLPRLHTSMVKETPWEACVNNEIWVPVHPNNPNMSKQLPRVRKLRNGLVHVECDCFYGPATPGSSTSIMLPAGYVPYRTIEIPMTLTFVADQGRSHYMSARVSPNADGENPDPNGSHIFIPYPVGYSQVQGTRVRIDTVFDQRYLIDQ